ncbi:MAG: hypothetical protein ACK41E_09155 [Deinococcales bacterium]
MPRTLPRLTFDRGTLSLYPLPSSHGLESPNGMTTLSACVLLHGNTTDCSKS